MHTDHAHSIGWLHGPRLWAMSTSAGGLAGAVWAILMPPAAGAEVVAPVPLVLVAPFALLLAMIAMCPLACPRWWHRHYPDAALFLGAIVGAYYVFGRAGSGGPAAVAHTGVEYTAFIALVGGLYIASGGVLVRLGSATPTSNTLVLLAGAVLANIVGTTGASMLLIRPFMKANQGRLRPLHVVFFIFVVSNCGGLLTPIGDPPLYLGFVKGVPFFWTVEHLWLSWLIVVSVLLAVFFAYDARVRGLSTSGAQSPRADGIGIEARPITVLIIALMVGAVFIDPLLSRHVDLHHVPVGALVQILLACFAFATARRDILAANEFSFEPVREVGLLFAGIFLTMIPALGYLAANGASLGIESPTSFYFATGGLSAVLDNAPTYLNFLQVATAPLEVTRQSISSLLSAREGVLTLEAISTGAVFFGAMTYIGNGPNFMVRSIAERAGVKMPSFFAYAGWACVILLPVLVLHWWIIVR